MYFCPQTKEGFTQGDEVLQYIEDYVCENASVMIQAFLASLLLVFTISVMTFLHYALGL